MEYDSKKKKLSFRILTSIMLLCVIAFLFIPNIMLSTKTTKTDSTNTVSSTFSGADVILGTFASDKTEVDKTKIETDGSYGAEGVFYLKTEGQNKGITTKRITNTLGLFMLFTALFAGMAAVLNFFTIGEKWPKYNKHIDPMISFLIIASAVCAIVSFALSFFWISGEYSNGMAGNALVRTTMQSYGYIGMIGNIILPALAYVFFHDRRIKEE